MSQSLCCNDRIFARTESLPDASVFGSKLLSYLLQRVALPIKQNMHVRSHICRLLFLGCPSAILWRVRSVVVDAIDRVMWRWARTHISVKVGERMNPSIADSNASASIVRVLLRVSVKAPCFQSLPDPVLNSRSSIRRTTGSMDLRPSTDFLFSKTPTRRGVSRKKVSLHHHFLSATFTATQEESVAPCLAFNQLRQDSQARENSANHHAILSANWARGWMNRLARQIEALP